MIKAKSNLKSTIFFVFYNLIIVIGIIGLLEVLFSYFLFHPNSIPHFLLTPAQRYYSFNFRNTIQMDTACAQYDSGLFYTLKPGTCVFSNIEFKTQVSVNKLGVRDTEVSAQNPEIIFLGDSFTMGWGTPQDSNFVSFFRNENSSKILNAGVSSYGTAREMLLLERINTDSLKTLVIQYHNNDFEENKAFISNHYKLKISSQKDYLDNVKKVETRSRYYFGKHTANMGRNLIKNWMGHYDLYKFDPEEVKAFINVLTHAKTSLKSTRIVVMETCSYNNYISKFSDALQKETENNSYPDYIRNIKIIKLGDILTNEDYYILDDHIRPSGHKKIADKLLKNL